MGHREYFIYITGKGTIEDLLEKVSKRIKFNDYDSEEPTIEIYCKSKVLKSFTNGIDGLEKSTVGAVISPIEMTSDELDDLFSDIEDIEFSIFDIWGLPEDYEKLFKDSEIKIGDKTYFLK